MMNFNQAEDRHVIEKRGSTATNTAKNILAGTMSRQDSRQGSSRQDTAPFGQSSTGHDLPHPDWEKINGGAVPNQHGHVLLTEYTMKPAACGLGYGPTHRTYYGYLSHYKQDLTEKDLEKHEAEGAKGFKARPCPKEYAHALGYGPQHQKHYWYTSPKTLHDL